LEIEAGAGLCLRLLLLSLLLATTTP